MTKETHLWSRLCDISKCSSETRSLHVGQAYSLAERGHGSKLWTGDHRFRIIFLICGVSVCHLNGKSSIPSSNWIILSSNSKNQGKPNLWYLEKQSGATPMCWIDYMWALCFPTKLRNGTGAKLISDLAAFPYQIQTSFLKKQIQDPLAQNRHQNKKSS